MTTSTLDSYDAIPYPGDPVATMHPDHLAALGRLYGVPTTSPDACRVLELGCCDGGNLIPLAIAFPRSTFVGVDLSRLQIEAGRAEVAALGLTNLDLRHAGILDLSTDSERFDYLLCHGVYSWVSPAVQARILTLARELLTPAGVACISYNTFPGWHVAGVVRHTLLFAGREETTLPRRLACARAALTFLERSLANDSSPYAQQLTAFVVELQQRPDYYLAHEYLEEFNEPVWFAEFVARAEAEGLAFLAEAIPATMEPALFSPSTQQALAAFATDRVAREQGLDLVRNRRFRQTLLCHKAALVRNEPDAADLRDLQASSEARRQTSSRPGTETYALSDGLSVTTSEPELAATFAALEAAWPKSLPVRDLPAPPTQLLACWMRGLLEVGVCPPRCGPVREYPATCAWTRRQGARGATVTDLRHRLVELDHTERLILPLLDGHTNCAGIVAWLTERVQSGKIVLGEGPPPEGELLRGALTEIVAVVLRNLGRQALLLTASSS